MRRIASHRFIWENHCGTLRYSIFELWNFDEHKPKNEWQVVGYCLSSNLPFRADKGKYAVLLERIKNGEIGEQVWLHIDYRDNAEWETQFQ